MSAGTLRLVLTRRASGRDYAVVLGPDTLRVEGGLGLRRRVAYRRVDGLGRRGAWLWLGTGLVPVPVGGRDVPAERLATLEAALRSRIAALPDGAGRIERIDRRSETGPHAPWLAGALAVGLAAALLPRSSDQVVLATALCWLLAVGLPLEGWLDRRPLLASGLAGLLGAVASGAAPGLALVTRALPAAWIGLAVFVRLRREAQLGVLARSVVDGVLLVAPAFAAQAVATGARPALLAAAGVAGYAGAALGLRRRPPRAGAAARGTRGERPGLH